MSSHPNVILMAVLTPDELPSDTMRAILATNSADANGHFDIIDVSYRSILMRDVYDSDLQISASEGDLVFYDLVTYGYGDTITWEKLQERQSDLAVWALRMCIEHHCKYKIMVSANYW